MNDHLNEIVLMLDSFFKGLTDVGIILSYNVQIQKITLDDVTVTAKIKNTILLLIRRLKKIYSTLSYRDHNGSKVAIKGNTIDASSEVKITKQKNYSKLSTSENCDQATGELVVAYAPFSLASTVNKSFLTGSSIVGKASNQNCSNSSLINAESLVTENQIISTNPDLPDKQLPSLLDLGKTGIDTEGNDNINTIEVFNVDSIIISEDSLRNWNALHSANNADEI
ncbi:hypothetical protein LSTR_LSTR004075, partial [Laodelphax striatellus]